MNTDYKILAKCIALRLKKVTPKIISSDQTGFLQGRYIGENIRLTLDMIEYINHNNLAGLLLFVDFEKAFDKLDWSFMFNVLRFFNFGPDLISWIKILYNDISSCTMNNGHASDFFSVRCGVRQGCPLSPLLFIICIEILSLFIRNDERIEGIHVYNSNIRVSLYADDVTIYLKSERDLRRIIQILDSFKILSGLTMNRDKSELIALGYYKAHPPDVSFSGLMYSTGPVKLLGVVLVNNFSELIRLNYLPKLEKLKNILHIWSGRDISPLGKIVVVKSLALSQLTFLFSVLPNPPDDFIKELEKTIYAFVWNNKPDKINRLTIIGGYDQGGLKMPHIPSMLSGLKIAWVKRILDDSNFGKWKYFFNYHLHCLGANFVWNCNMNPLDRIIKNIKNIFIKDVLSAWCSFTFTPIVDLYQLNNQYIWNNHHIRIGEDTLVRQSWIDKGITKIKHLLCENGTYLSYFNLKRKYNVDCTYAEYFSLKCAIPPEWIDHLKNADFSLQVDHTTQDQLVNDINRKAKVCKFIHKKLVDKIFKIPISQDKWSEKLTERINDWKSIYLSPIRSCISTKLRYFQYRIIHRILGVNDYTFRMGLVNSNVCSMCLRSVESILHLFWDCPVIQNFILELKTSILDNTQIDRISFLFGNKEWDKYFNYVILYAKYFIFTAKLNNHKPSIAVFKNKLEQAYRIEQYVSAKHNTFTLSLDNRRIALI